eukprot:3562352-Rhodomonas_salina.1
MPCTRERKKAAWCLQGGCCCCGSRDRGGGGGGARAVRPPARPLCLQVQTLLYAATLRCYLAASALRTRYEQPGTDPAYRPTRRAVLTECMVLPARAVPSSFSSGPTRPVPSPILLRPVRPRTAPGTVLRHCYGVSGTELGRGVVPGCRGLGDGTLVYAEDGASVTVHAAGTALAYRPTRVLCALRYWPSVWPSVC